MHLHVEVFIIHSLGCMERWLGPRAEFDFFNVETKQPREFANMSRSFLSASKPLKSAMLLQALLSCIGCMHSICIVYT